MRKFFLVLFLVSCSNPFTSGTSSSQIADTKYLTFLQRVKNNEFSKMGLNSTYFQEFTYETTSSGSWFDFTLSNWVTTNTYMRGKLGANYSYTQGYFDSKNIHSFEISGSLTEAAMLKMMVGLVESARSASICSPDLFAFEVGNDTFLMDLRLPIHLNPVYRFNSSNKHGYLVNSYTLPGYCPYTD